MTSVHAKKGWKFSDIILDGSVAPLGAGQAVGRARPCLGQGRAEAGGRAAAETSAFVPNALFIAAFRRFWAKIALF